MYTKLLSIAVLLCVCSSALSYKILVMCPFPSRSHNNLGKGIVDILHNANHEVTFITAFKDEKAKYRQIVVLDTMHAMDKIDMGFEKLSKTSAIEMLYQLPTMTSLVFDKMYSSKEFQQLYNDKNEKFDLVIIEYFLNHGFAGLGVRFDCPVVIISSIAPMHWLARVTGNPVDPSIIPNAFLNFNQEMTFVQRTINTFMAVFQEIFGIFVNDRIQEEMYKKHLPVEAAKVPFSELGKKIALVMSNSHPAIGYARPLLPNVVEIGGYHIGESKELPQEYKQIMENAKNGVIFFSMGSNLKSKDLPPELKKQILNALGKRKETILWKYEEDLADKPKNVIIRSWMPQASILNHPNLKLFISHGGLLSTTEAASAGVPVLSIPIFGDQFANAQATQDRGCGIFLQYTNLSESSLTWGLNEVLGNPKYTLTAKKVHQLYHDRPMKPKDLVTFYTEHVIKTGGAKHLSAPVLPAYSALLLDVLVVLLLPPLFMLIVFIWLIKKCCQRSKSKNVPPKPKQKKH